MNWDLNQITIEWPFYVSMRAFCHRVLAEIDKLIGAHYQIWYPLQKTTLDKLYSGMKTIAEVLDLVAIIVPGGPFQGPLTASERRKLHGDLDKFQDITKITVIFQQD